MSKPLSPETIIERHESFPDATKQLINAFAYQQYRAAVADIERCGDVLTTKYENVVIIAINKGDWERIKSGDNSPCKYQTP